MCSGLQSRTGFSSLWGWRVAVTLARYLCLHLESNQSGWVKNPLFYHWIIETWWEGWAMSPRCILHRNECYITLPTPYLIWYYFCHIFFLTRCTGYAMGNQINSAYYFCHRLRFSLCVLFGIWHKLAVHVETKIWLDYIVHVLNHLFII